MTRSPYPDSVNYRDIKAPVHVVFTNRRISIEEISPDEYPGTVVTNVFTFDSTLITFDSTLRTFDEAA